MQIAITGIGVVSPIGIGQEEFFAALSNGRSGLDNGFARVGDFGAKQEISAANLRRMPRMVQMTIVATKQALRQAALLENPAYDPSRMGIVLGTGLGTLEETVRFIEGYLEGGAEAASPQLFPQSVMNAAASLVAMEYKLRGVNTTINHRDASPLGAMAMACDLLALGRADAIVVGGADELSEAALDAYRAFVQPGAQARPYDKSPQGFGFGEAAAILVLERLEDAKKRGATILGQIVAVGQNSDHRPRIGWGTGPWPAAESLLRSVAAQGSPDFVVGQGNGSSMDATELSVVRAALGGKLPIYSILGQTGESYASSALRVLSVLAAVRDQSLPSTVGVRDPLDPAVGPARPVAARRGLVHSFAMGGANVAVVVEGTT